jgi:hypothetical protein
LQRKEIAKMDQGAKPDLSVTNQSQAQVSADAMVGFQAHPHVIDRFSETLRPELIEQALEATAHHG